MSDPSRAPRSAPRVRAGGFMLLEVLVAFLILALSVPVLMQALGGGLRNDRQAGQYGRAISVAESVIAAAGAQGTLPAGRLHGHTDGLDWTREVEPYGDTDDDGTAPLRPMRIIVTVRTPVPAKREFRMQTIRLSASGDSG
ncbi:MAG: hypothetical protein AB7Q97_12360 [Gammaproteobacteria bacterium]